MINTVSIIVISLLDLGSGLIDGRGYAGPVGVSLLIIQRSALIAGQSAVYSHVKAAHLSFSLSRSLSRYLDISRSLSRSLSPASSYPLRVALHVSLINRYALISAICGLGNSTLTTLLTTTSTTLAPYSPNPFL